METMQFGMFKQIIGNDEPIIQVFILTLELQPTLYYIFQ